MSLVDNRSLLFGVTSELDFQLLQTWALTATWANRWKQWALEFRSELEVACYFILEEVVHNLKQALGAKGKQINHLSRQSPLSPVDKLMKLIVLALPCQSQYPIHILVAVVTEFPL